MITTIAYVNRTDMKQLLKNQAKYEVTYGVRQAFVRLLARPTRRRTYSVETVRVVKDGLPGRRYVRRVRYTKLLSAAQRIAREYVK